MVPVAEPNSLGGYGTADLSRSLTSGGLYSPAVGSSYTFSDSGARAIPALRPLLLPGETPWCNHGNKVVKGSSALRPMGHILLNSNNNKNRTRGANLYSQVVQ